MDRPVHNWSGDKAGSHTTVSVSSKRVRSLLAAVLQLSQKRLQWTRHAVLDFPHSYKLKIGERPAHTASREKGVYALVPGSVPEVCGV